MAETVLFLKPTKHKPSKYTSKIMRFIKKDSSSIITTTKTTTNRRRVVFFAVVAALVVSVGYITALAVLAPEQLAEATTAATDLVCSGCVGTTDIANNAVTSGKIGNGQVHNADIGGNAVTNSKIADGQVFSSDIADVTIGASDIADSAITSSKLAGGAVKLNIHKLEGGNFNIAPGAFATAEIDCDVVGAIVTGGGFEVGGTNQVNVVTSEPFDQNTWRVTAFNGDRVNHGIQPWAVCINPSIP